MCQINKIYKIQCAVNQIIRCSCSVGNNYRASQRAKSAADFINKLKIVEEEADESHFFIETLFDMIRIEKQEVALLEEMEILKKEGNRLVAIVISSIKTAGINNSK